MYIKYISTQHFTKLEVINMNEDHVLGKESKMEW